MRCANKYVYITLGFCRQSSRNGTAQRKEKKKGEKAKEKEKELRIEQWYHPLYYLCS